MGRNRTIDHQEDDNDNATRRQIRHNEHLRLARPMFQRSDNVVGEDFLLLSAVDEADAYVMVAVELMHLLRFICVNVIAVRKICKKHDRLLANRMLGGYYHRQRRDEERKSNALYRKKKSRRRRSERRKSRRNNQRTHGRGGRRGRLLTPPMLGGILAVSMNDKDGGYTAATNTSSQYSAKVKSCHGARDRLLGVHDARIQRLANSSTVQMISSALALALSEYEISHSRADALSRPNSYDAPPPKKRDSAFVEHDRDKITPPLSSIKCSPLPRGIGSAFGLSSYRLRQAMRTRMTGDCMDFDRDDSADEAMSENNEDGGPPSTSSSISLTRLRFAVASVFGLREAARMKANRFHNFLSRSLVSFTGPHVVGDGIDGCSRETLDFLVAYEPDAALLLDSHVLFNCLNAGRVEENNGVGGIGSVMMSSLAIAVESGNLVPSSASVTRRADPKEEGDGMVDATAALSIMPNAHSLDRKSVHLLQAMQQHSSEKSILPGSVGPSRRTIILNLTATFLFTTNYYIISPTARTYAKSFGGNSAHSAALIGVTNLSSLVSAIVHRYMILKKSTGAESQTDTSFFFTPLLLSAVFSLLGNILYSYAFQLSSMWVAISGRILIGFGCSEVLNRHFFASCISPMRLVPETAKFVQASILGFFIGPFIGAMMNFLGDELVVFGRCINTLTLPGHVMSIFWFLQIVGLLQYFDLPENRRESDASDNTVDHLDHVDMNSDTTSEFNGEPQETDRLLLTSDLTKPIGLKAAYGSHSSMIVDSLSGDDISPKKEQSRVHISARTFAKSMNRVRKLVFRNIALPVTLALFALVNLTVEVVFSSCAIITHRYFKWSPTLTGVFLAALAFVVLPINFFVASENLNERKLMKITLVSIGFGLLLMVNVEALARLAHDIKRIFVEDANTNDDENPLTCYDWSFGIVQYVLGVCIVFMSCIVLKGATVSLMSKVSPAKLSSTITDCGFIVTIISLLGRFTGDILILIVGLSHRIINTDIINSLSFCLICVCCAGYYIVKKHYFFLIPP